METPLKASVSEVTIDEATGLARFVITCEIINGDDLEQGPTSPEVDTTCSTSPEAASTQSVSLELASSE